MIEALRLQGFSQTTLAVSAVAAQTAALERGLFDVWVDADTHIKVGPIADDVTTSTGYKVYAGNTITLAIGAGDKIGAIAAGATSLHYHRVGDVE